jgi:hypothetical protein
VEDEQSSESKGEIDLINTTEARNPHARRKPAPHAGYTSWSVVAGFFDGDGNIEEVLGQFTINVRIGFTDNWDRQLLAVRSFLQLNGVRTGRLTKKKTNQQLSAWQLRITNLDGTLRASKKFLQHSYKKKAELRALVDYLEDRITGDELVTRVNHEIEIGNKTGKLRTSKLPYTRSEGMSLRYKFSLERAHAASRIDICEDEQLAIRHEYNSCGLTLRELSESHGYSVSVIQRVLGKR